jgi:peptidoglycan/xylan/chitin deacetylase (PgdA/CDA1 family)
MTDVYFSYDYELLWGVWDGTGEGYAQRNVAAANDVAAYLVDLHKKHHIPATFAIVGAMLGELAPLDIMTQAGRTQDDLNRFKTVFIPKAVHKDMVYVNKAALAEMAGNALFEIASHTFTHFYALKASDELIKKDFEAFNDLLKAKTGRAATSLVMPKNQMTSEVLAVAADYGFRVVRMNPDSWLYRPVNRAGVSAKLIRVLRFADTFVPLLELFADRSRHVAEISKVKVNKGQYFVRPFLRFGFLNWLHRQRLKIGFHYCALRQIDCHFWSHPHNFGAGPDAAIDNFEKLLIWLKAKESDGRVVFKLMKDT